MSHHDHPIDILDDLLSGATPLDPAARLDPEPWDVAAARGMRVRDFAGVVLLLAFHGLLLVLPPWRLWVLTALRLAIAGLAMALSLALPGLLAKIAYFVASGFLLLALLSLAAHVEAVTLGPLVDRIAGRDRP